MRSFLFCFTGREYGDCDSGVITVMIIVIKVLIKRRLLSGETSLSACAHNTSVLSGETILSACAHNTSIITRLRTVLHLQTT